MKTFLLPPLVTTEAISVARRRDERGEGRCCGREKKTTRERGERGEEEEREAFPLASPHDGIFVAREKVR